MTILLNSYVPQGGRGELVDYCNFYIYLLARVFAWKHMRTVRWPKNIVEHGGGGGMEITRNHTSAIVRFGCQAINNVHQYA